MSIAVLQQVYEETRRVAIGGSGLAKDDFRLKKLVAPLEQSAQRAPVFGQVAKAIDKAVSSDEKEVSGALLDLSSLVLAILYTQGKTDCEGSTTEIKTLSGLSTSQQSSAQLLQPVIKAIRTKGSGRLNVIQQAYEQGVFQDARMLPYALDALEDGAVDIANLVATEVLPAYGKSIYPEVFAKLDIKSKASYARRLKLLHALDPQAARPLVLSVLEKGAKNIRLAALECLGNHPDDLPHLLAMANSDDYEFSSIALSRLGSYEDEAVADVLIAAMKGVNQAHAKVSIQTNKNPRLIKEYCNYLSQVFDNFFTPDDTYKAPNRLHLFFLLDVLQGRDEAPVINLLAKIYDARETILQPKEYQQNALTTVQKVMYLMLESGNNDLRKRLVDDRQKLSPKLFDCNFVAGLLTLTPEAFHDAYAPIFINPEERLQRRAFIEELISDPRKSDDFRKPNTLVTHAIENAIWDKRWLDTAIAAGSYKAALVFGEAGDPKLKKFLLEQFDTLPENFMGDHPRLDILVAIINFGYEEATDQVVKFFKMFNGAERSKQFRSEFLQRAASQIAKLPPSSIPVLEAMLTEMNPQFFELLSPYVKELKNASTNTLTAN